jgi:ATP-dependent RNA helicase DOB1
MIYDISSVRLYAGLTPDLKSMLAKKHVINNMFEVRKHFSTGEFPSLTPAELGLKVDDKYSKRIQSLEGRLNFSALNSMPPTKRNAYFDLYQRKQLMKDKLEELKKTESQSHLLMFRAELKKRMRVLRRLGHISAEGVMLQKGNVAAEVESVDELLITELIFEGLFNELEPAACCALLTCLFPMEKTKQPIAVREELLPAIAKLKQAARHVATVQVECKLEGIEVEEYVESFFYHTLYYYL